MIKLTKEQLKEMSDFEVNATLADLLNVKWQISAVDDECLMVGSEVLDYCNTPNDIIPLAFEHGISLIKLDDAWASTNNAESYITDSSFRFNEVGGISDWHKNPLRAIACCLILVLQEKS